MKTFAPLPTYQALLDQVELLTSRGWDVHPSDEPEVAEVGFVLSKTFGESYTRMRRLTWHPWGRRLSPVKFQVGDPSAFFTLFQSHVPHRLYKCDDPPAKMLGVVCYCRQKDRMSTVIQFPFEVAYELGPDFLQLRNQANRENLKHLLLDA